MKFNPVVIRAVMHTQFHELRQIGGIRAPNPEDHYSFRAEDVEDLYFNRGNIGKGVWFRLKDGRIFDVLGEVAAPATPEGLAERGALPEVLSDLDAMDALPLSMISLTSKALRSARLVKNARLETALELHRDAKAGSLQIRPEDVPTQFPGHHADHRVISSLASLNSFDVYALRTSLRKLGIETEPDALNLSPETQTRLRQHASEFTRPLLAAVYGNGSMESEQDFGKLFRDRKQSQVVARLKQMSERTGIPMEDIPDFLETYSDLFMSVIYYRENFERIAPDVDRCATWLKDISLQRDGAASAQNAAHFRRVDEAMRILSTSIRGRLNGFRRAFDLFWRDMNRGALVRLKSEIEAKHEGTGGMLCGLTVKMRHWSRNFQTRTSGGPSTRMQYVVSEMEPGLERLCKLL